MGGQVIAARRPATANGWWPLLHPEGAGWLSRAQQGAPPAARSSLAAPPCKSPDPQPSTWLRLQAVDPSRAEKGSCDGPVHMQLLPFGLPSTLTPSSGVGS